jgi:hypothetical protein
MSILFSAWFKLCDNEDKVNEAAIDDYGEPR